jgi:hypothetical protein
MYGTLECLAQAERASTLPPSKVGAKSPNRPTSMKRYERGLFGSDIFSICATGPTVTTFEPTSLHTSAFFHSLQGLSSTDRPIPRTLRLTIGTPVVALSSPTSLHRPPLQREGKTRGGLAKESDSPWLHKRSTQQGRLQLE